MPCHQNPGPGLDPTMFLDFVLPKRKVNKNTAEKKNFLYGNKNTFLDVKEAPREIYDKAVF